MEWGNNSRSRPPSALEQWLLVLAILVVFLLLAGSDGLMGMIFPR